MKTKLKIRQIKECINRNPTISSMEEFAAVLNVNMDKLDAETKGIAKELVERNRLRMQVLLKQELYASKDKRSHELLFKMICDKDELGRFGVKTDGSTVNVSPVVEIKAADPNIIDKVKQL